MVNALKSLFVVDPFQGIWSNFHSICGFLHQLSSSTYLNVAANISCRPAFPTPWNPQLMKKEEVKYKSFYFRDIRGLGLNFFSNWAVCSFLFLRSSCGAFVFTLSDIFNPPD